MNRVPPEGIGNLTLNQNETTALRDLLAMLATMEERALRRDGVLEVSQQLWRDTVGKAGERLRRVSEWRRG